MNNKKSPSKLVHEYSVEELLQLISTADSNEEIKKTSEEDEINNEVIKFLVFYDIKPGKHKIRTKTLYKLFCAWNKKTDLTYIKFLRGMNDQFKFVKRQTLKNYDPHINANKSLLQLTKYIEDAIPRKVVIQKNKNNLKYMEEFLNKNGLKPGPVYIESDILYYLFDYENHKKRRKPISYMTFVSICRLYFKSRQLGYGSTWFGLNEAIKDLITPEWVKVWRQGRVKYGYIIKKNEKKKKDELYTTTWSDEEIQKRKILYPETLPEKKPKE